MSFTPPPVSVVPGPADTADHAALPEPVRVLVLGRRARACTLGDDVRAAEVVPYAGRDIELRFASTVSSRWLDRWANVVLVDSEELGSREGLWLDVAWGFGVPSVVLQPATGFPSMDAVENILSFARLRADHWREPAVLDALVRAADAGEDGVPTRDFEVVRDADDWARDDTAIHGHADDTVEFRDRVERVPLAFGGDETTVATFFAALPDPWRHDARRKLESHLRRGATSFDVELCLGHADSPAPWRFTVAYTSLGVPRTIVVRPARRRISAGFSNVGDESVTAAYPLASGSDHRLELEVQAAIDAIGTGRSRGVAIAIVDVANLGSVRTHLGDEAGEAYLDALLARIRARAGRVDEAAMRVDDRVVLVRRGIASHDACDALVSGLREALLAAIHVNMTDIFPEVTVGATWTTEPTDDPAGLVREAIASTYWAREGQRQGSLVVELGGVEPAAEHLLLEAELAQALVEDQLDLFFQPIVEIATSQPVGAEALVRWRHPARGWVAPGTILTICERLGLMHVLTRRTLQRACGWLVSTRLPEEFIVAVNMTAAQVLHRDFVDDVYTALRTSQVSPRRLAIEVSSLATDEVHQRLVAALRRVDALGVRVHLDGFGGAGASLGALMDFPVDRIKLDPSLLQRTVIDARVEQAARRIVQLAQDLDIDVVAAGVETRSHAELVAQFGCRFAQGYLYCCPLDESSASAHFDRLALVAAR